MELSLGDRGLRSFVTAFAITQLVEVPIYLAALRSAAAPEPATAEDAVAPEPATAEDAAAPEPATAEDARANRRAPRSKGARAAIAFGASLLTHPIVWFVMPALSARLYAACALMLPGARGLGVTGQTLLYGALAEGFAVAAEALYLRAFGVQRALAWSAGANAASVIVGTLVVWGLGL
jgi:hypothetical protein